MEEFKPKPPPGFTPRMMFNNDDQKMQTYYSDIRIQSRQFSDKIGKANRSIWPANNEHDLNKFASVRPNNLFTKQPLISDKGFSGATGPVVAAGASSGPFGPPVTPASVNECYSGGVTMRQRPALPPARKKSPSKRHAVYVEPADGASKPPLPPIDGSNSSAPKPPPRTRPKSWTSSLFNAMKNNHRSVTFQCVDEEKIIISDENSVKGNNDRKLNETNFNSLPRSKPNSRTPSPFRTMVKGLFLKGQTAFANVLLRSMFEICVFPFLQVWFMKIQK